MDIALGLVGLETCGMVHSDIKSDNILLDKKKGRAYIGDYGSSRSVGACASPLWSWLDKRSTTMLTAYAQCHAGRRTIWPAP